MTKAEITLQQFLESSWFRHTARLLMVVCGVLSAYIAWGVWSTQDQVASNTGKIAALNAGVLTYKASQDAYQDHASAALATIQIQVARMQGTLEAIRRDTTSEPATFHVGSETPGE